MEMEGEEGQFIMRLQIQMVVLVSNLLMYGNLSQEVGWIQIRCVKYIC